MVEIQPCITRSLNEELMYEFKEDEVVEAMKLMAPLKASSKDDFSAFFYQNFWHIVGKDVIRYCLEVLNSRGEFEELNRTNIELIPKVSTSKNMRQFRLISLCNSVSYSVLLNGFQEVDFKLTSGLRREGIIDGARVGRGGLSVVHLFFADDNILFGEASIEGVMTMKSMVNEYEKVLGQLVNFDKSLVYFNSNVYNGKRD
ncbi:reverse transcriptase [Gossypium australe]|uniref:Reverse transcriptase n=1 Tax=Gossypium australe TaxID=47621 RepID=A0A5B6W6A8_9ROSI|nr:reverse transcriptase [Gossypium australe]